MTMQMKLERMAAEIGMPWSECRDLSALEFARLVRVVRACRESAAMLATAAARARGLT